MTTGLELPGWRPVLSPACLTSAGGQKARVALARAAYCRSSVLLLDDPLSAVDPRVGRTLFHNAIMDVMAGVHGVEGELVVWVSLA